MPDDDRMVQFSMRLPLPLKQQLEHTTNNLTGFFVQLAKMYLSLPTQKNELLERKKKILEELSVINVQLENIDKKHKHKDIKSSLKDSALHKIVNNWLLQNRYNLDDSVIRWWLNNPMCEDIHLAGFNNSEDALVWLRKLDNSEKCEKWLQENEAKNP